MKTPFQFYALSTLFSPFRESQNSEKIRRRYFHPISSDSLQILLGNLWGPLAKLLGFRLAGRISRLITVYEPSLIPMILDAAREDLQSLDAARMITVRMANVHHRPFQFVQSQTNTFSHLHAQILRCVISIACFRF